MGGAEGVVLALVAPREAADAAVLRAITAVDDHHAFSAKSGNRLGDRFSYQLHPLRIENRSRRRHDAYSRRDLFLAKGARLPDIVENFGVFDSFPLANHHRDLPFAGRLPALVAHLAAFEHAGFERVFQQVVEVGGKGAGVGDGRQVGRLLAARHHDASLIELQNI